MQMGGEFFICSAEVSRLRDNVIICESSGILKFFQVIEDDEVWEKMETMKINLIK
jgi:hypothetical protein